MVLIIGIFGTYHKVYMVLIIGIFGTYHKGTCSTYDERIFGTYRAGIFGIYHEGMHSTVQAEMVVIVIQCVVVVISFVATD